MDQMNSLYCNNLLSGDQLLEEQEYYVKEGLVEAEGLVVVVVVGLGLGLHWAGSKRILGVSRSPDIELHLGCEQGALVEESH